MFFLAMTAASAGAFWWLHLRDHRAGERASAKAFDEDAGIAIHVARHEVETRRHQPSTLHLLYGLVQVEAVRAAIAGAGGDADALEAEVLAALAAPVADESALLERMLRRAAPVAHGEERPISCADLWAYLGESRATMVVAAAGIDRTAVLFGLVHGAVPPALPADDRGMAMVELRNDAYTTKAFVVEALIEGFGLAPAEAEPIMESVHQAGHGTLGPMAMATARVGVIAVRDLAQRSGSPLWIVASVAPR
jgi:ATP-dependent Clp protease adapter protein ClpS